MQYENAMRHADSNYIMDLRNVNIDNWNYA